MAHRCGAGTRIVVHPEKAFNKYHLHAGSMDLDDRVTSTAARQERRDSYRLTPPEYGLLGLLHVKRKTIDVEVINESAGGFLVSVPPSLEVKEGQIMSLGSDAACWQVLVIHCESNGDQQQVGLKRLSEVPVSRQKAGTRIIIGLIVALLAALYFLRPMLRSLGS